MRMVETFVAAKKGQDEVKMHLESEEDKKD